jgi:hypothetical protein
MKFRRAVFCLVAFSMLICAAQGVEHFIHARAIKTTLSIMQANDREIERVQGTLQTHYRAIEGSIAIIVAQGILIFLLIRGDHGRPVA